MEQQKVGCVFRYFMETLNNAFAITVIVVLFVAIILSTDIIYAKYNSWDQDLWGSIVTFAKILWQIAVTAVNLLWKSASKITTRLLNEMTGTVPFANLLPNFNPMSFPGMQGLQLPNVFQNFKIPFL